MLKLQVFGAIVGALTYPLGVAAQSGLCSYNPFLSLRPPDGSEIFVPCSLYSDDMAACWAQPECYYFDDSMQLSPECANLPVYWPYLDQTLMVTMEDADSSVTFVGGDAFGPSAKYACIPAVLASTTLCYDSVDVYPENTYVVLFGVPAGFDIIEVDLTTQLKKSKYVSMSVYALSAESPDPLGNCVVKSLGTNMALSVDSFQEYVVAIRLKRFANQTDIIGDSVAITISSDNNLYPAGDGKPIPEPLKYIGTCPFNWAEAVETACTDGPVICRYSYRYVGCTYEELNCLEYYNCDCEPFLETWRCWGLNELPTCPNDAPTLDLLGQSCDPRAKLPENPNPPPAVCPASAEDAVATSCDSERIQRCEYDYKWFGCFPGELVCQPNDVCDCEGQWYCRGSQNYCTNTTAGSIPALGTSCDPDDCPPSVPNTGGLCTTSKTCVYNYSYSGCDWTQLKCEPENTCQCNDGRYECIMRADPLCLKPPGFPEGPCDPNNALPLPP
jgi:hypothetical protein